MTWVHFSIQSTRLLTHLEDNLVSVLTRQSLPSAAMRPVLTLVCSSLCSFENQITLLGQLLSPSIWTMPMKEFLHVIPRLPLSLAIVFPVNGLCFWWPGDRKITPVGLVSFFWRRCWQWRPEVKPQLLFWAPSSISLTRCSGSFPPTSGILCLHQPEPAPSANNDQGFTPFY